MRKNVMIRLTSVQRDESGEDEKISLETPGIYGEEEGYSFVTYEETGLAGLEGTTTKLVCYPGVRFFRGPEIFCMSRSMS